MTKVKLWIIITVLSLFIVSGLVVFLKLALWLILVAGLLTIIGWLVWLVIAIAPTWPG